MEHLWSAWERLLPRFQDAPLVYLMLDYDGTLAPIVARPELAILPPDMRRRLRCLAAHRRYRIAIISGRSLADLKKRAGVKGMAYAGNHGLEIEFRGRRTVHPGAASSRSILKRLARALSLALADVPGAHVEDKGLTLSLHYRQVAREGIAQVRRAVRELALPLERRGRLRITRGKKVYEFRSPLEWDKGRAVTWILGQWYDEGEAPLPLFLWDDRTDEDGFRAVRELEGIAIRVGRPAPSLAPYYLRSPKEVGDFLERLLE